MSGVVRPLGVGVVLVLVEVRLLGVGVVLVEVRPLGTCGCRPRVHFLRDIGTGHRDIGPAGRDIAPEASPGGTVVRWFGDGLTPRSVKQALSASLQWPVWAMLIPARPR